MGEKRLKETRVREKFYSSMREDPFLLPVVAISIFFSVLFSLLSVNKFESMNATGYDLGLFSQAFFSTLKGHIFYTNLLGESYLTEHFSPILFVYLVPFYLHSSPTTLLWIQGFVLGLAAIPLFLLSRKWIIMTGRRDSKRVLETSIIPFVLSISYLLSPMVSAPISFDFHIMTALPLFFFSAFYFFLKRNRLLHAVFLILIVSLHSSFAIIVIFLLISEYLIFKSPEYYGRKSPIKVLSRRSLQYFAIFVLITGILMAYYYGISYIKPIFSGLPPDLSGPSLRQAGALSNSPIGLILSFFTKPGVVWSHLLSNIGFKGAFLFIGFAPTAFIGVLFPELLITVIPYLLYGMFSSFLPYYTVGYQYSMMLIPMIYVAVIGGIIRIVNSRFPYRSKKKTGITTGTHRKEKNAVISALIIIGMVIGFAYTPISPSAAFHNPGAISNMWVEHQTNSSSLVKNISRSIPPDAYVVTQNDVFPFFSHDTNSYAAPWSPVLSGMTVNEFQYVVAYYGSDWVYTSSPSTYSLIDAALASGQFGIYASGYGVLALEKNYTSRPITFVPIQLSLHGQDILPVKSNSSYDHNGYVTAVNITNQSSFFTTNNNLIFPGNYSVEIQYSTSGSNPNGSFDFNISSRFSGTSLYNVTVPVSEGSNKTINASFEFSSNLVYNDIIFTGKNLYWGGSISIQKITVRQMQP